MKIQLFVASLLLSGCLLFGCAPRERVVENPLIEASNTMTLDIPRVELTDSATVLRMQAYFQPHYWIRIDGGSYLSAGGRKYRLIGADGITPDSLFWMPASGEASFTLAFEPLPRGTRSFDFIESDCDDCFKLYGIDLTGLTSYSEPEGLPDNVQAGTSGELFVEPVFKVGETTVNMHFIGYREGLGKQAAIYANTIFGQQQPYTAPIDPETATAVFRFGQYGTSYLFGGVGDCLESFWTAPGETIDVYVDLRTSGARLLDRRNGTQTCLRGCYTNGTYAGLNAVFGDLHNTPGFVSLNRRTGRFADYRMSADEYVQMVVDRYRTLADSIERCGAPASVQRLQLNTLRQETLAAFVEATELLEHNYRHVNQMWDYSKPLGRQFAKLGAEHYAEVCKLFDINDPALLVGPRVSDYVYAVTVPEVDWPAIAGIERGVVVDLRAVAGLPRKAENNQLTAEDFAQLREMENPFYAEALEAMQQRVQQALAEVEGKAVIEPTPEVPLAELFEAIVAPYRGKVVLVDFWNTWCGPCRASIAAVEPLKSAELANDDLVWVYIANETSPLVTYKTMIPGIRGKHFRLDGERWASLCDRFGIDGIPSYVVVDRDGSFRLRNDLRDHAQLRKVLLEKLAE